MDKFGEPAARIKSLRFSWPSANGWTLSVGNLRVKCGEHTLLLGSSGSGKTTLLGLLGGVLVPATGEIEVLGTRVDGLTSEQRDAFRAAHLGIVFQQFNLVDYLSILDNVLLPLRFSAERRARVEADGGEAREEARRLLARLGLDGPMLGRLVTRLSVGQQQRVAVARALIGAPALLLADEPTSALDANARDAFLDLLFEEATRADATIVYVSHDAAVTEHFHRCLEIGELGHAVLNPNRDEARCTS